MKSLAYASLMIAAFFAFLVAGAAIATGESPHAVDLLLVAIPGTIGITLWVLAPAFTSSVPTPIRVVMYLTGIFVLLSGMLWVNYVIEYGDGTNYEITTTGRFAQVYTVDEVSGGETLVFEGTPAQADQWVEHRRAGTRDTTLPFVTIAVGLLVTVGTLGLGWHHTGERYHIGTSHGHPAT